MITENGAVKTSTPITEEVQKELNKSTFILSIIYIVIGAVILAGGFVLYVLTEDSFGLILLVCGTIICAMGIILTVSHQSVKNNTLKYKKVDETEFFRDHVMVCEYVDGELITTTKLYYNRILRIKETPNYLFLFNTRATAVAVDKNSLPVAELNTILSLLGRVPKPVPAQGVQPAALPTEPAVPPAEPADPFADMQGGKDEKENKDSKEE